MEFSYGIIANMKSEGITGSATGAGPVSKDILLMI
jgi:hypothetical protein